MNDEQLNELLRSLPRRDSSAGFTTRVLSRLDEERREPARFPWAMAAALAAFVTVAGLSGQYFVEKQQSVERVEAFRVERQRITEELDELKRMAEQREPVIYLGGNEEAEYVIDLRSVEFDSIRPASYSSPH